MKLHIHQMEIQEKYIYTRWKYKKNTYTPDGNTRKIHIHQMERPDKQN